MSAEARRWLDFAAEDATMGGYIWLAGSSFWAGVVGFGDHPLVALRDDSLPRRRGMDVRTDGLWASLTCETPAEHWSAGMEAFATGYDDPDAALADERGDVVALGFDLEWERERDKWRVHGDVLVGEQRHAIDALGRVADDLPGAAAGVTRWRAPVKSDGGVVLELYEAASATGRAPGWRTAS